ncbi:MAG: rod shape-determining protein MreD [Rickettsiales bacterium]|nr:rod shape-determining protein MreD [Rickettsiales bacterium]
MAAAADRTHVSMGRRVVPPLCITLATLLHFSRLPVLDWLTATPALDLLALYYWTIARPNRVPVALLFILGLIADSLSTTPLGIHAVVYLVAYGLARWIRHHMEAPAILPMWGIFSVWLLCLLLLEWLLSGWQWQVLPPLSALPLQWMITLFLYPLIHLLFDRLLTFGQRWRI